MVLMRRKDKRKGNSESELAVASDASIVANKGVRSLGGARTGRFAADMRVQVGGYGRPDKTWGVDHPWHLTRDDLLNQMSSRDKMEEGFLVKEEEKKEGQGLSRAALKKKKKKAKLGGAGVGASEDGDASSRMSTHSVDAAQAHESKPESGDKEKKQEQRAPASTDADKNGEQPTATTDAAAGASKKRKRVKRNKKKLEKQRQMESGDISDELGDSDDEEEIELKPNSTNKKQKTATPTKADAPESAESAKKAKEADAKARDALAKQYELALGQEFKTASGLTIRDVRIGKGRVPAAGEMLTARYRGRIGDHSGFVFGKGMLTTNFGTGSVIAGWEEGMGTMRAGGIRYLTVPPELGYGEVAKGNGKIPPNSTLFFEVELVRIGKRKRDAIGKDETPLPSSFQRKRIPSAKNSAANAGDKKKGKSKRSRRKHSI